MATKKYAIRATVPAALKLTATEGTQLRDAFKTCVVDVLSATRPTEAAPFPEINIANPTKPRGSAKKRSSAKKKSSAKKARKR